MILSGVRIKNLVEIGEINIAPFEESRMNPNSYNLTLSERMLVYDDAEPLDMKKYNHTKEIIIPEEGFVLQPGRLYLGCTNEYTHTDKYVPMIEGRSSVGRLGIMVHATAGFGDVGFSGRWTLEISCVHPVKIYPNVEICQIYFHKISRPYVPYDGKKYQGSMEAKPSMMYLDFQKPIDS